MELFSWYFCLIIDSIIYVRARIDHPNYNLIFGTGRYTKDEIKNELLKHQSHSTEDLMKLFQTEKSMIQELNQMKSQINIQNRTSDLIVQYLNVIDYDMFSESSKYVLNPINAFHLLKRLSEWIPKLKSKIPKLKFTYKARSLLDDYKMAINGIVEIQEYFDLDTNDLAEGRIEDRRTGKIYQSNSPLTSSELFDLSEEAKTVGYLNNHVDWLTATLNKAVFEKKPQKYITKLRKNIRDAKIHHDKEYMEYEWDLEFALEPPKTNDFPYYPNEESLKITNIRNSEIEKYNSMQNNLFLEETSWLGKNFGRKIQNMKLDTFFRRKIQNLCSKDEQNISYQKSELNCLWLHHNHPYLKLGPFKFEVQHKEPEIAIIHEFASFKETKSIQDHARGQTKPTPYGDSNFSKHRTSKVMYMNENLEPAALTLSKKIELATHFRLYEEMYASENYQIMNYGIGGKITQHTDSPEIIFKKEYKEEDYTKNGVSRALLLEHGGPRLMTFMIYLSDVEAGGHTVFAQPNISVKPQRGTALYWFNMGANNNYDSRVRHCGCPVLYGNKWIANKWVKWLANFKNYPCLIHRKHYSIYQNNT